MAKGKTSGEEKVNTINIKSQPVQMHVGSSKYTNDDWGTIAFILDRRDIQNKFLDKELRFNCIYFLIGFDVDTEVCYVGQAKKRNNGESVLARLREHDVSATEPYRDKWDWAVVVTNKDDSWTLDDLNALEHAFYAEIPAEQNLNGNTPNAGGANFEEYKEKISQIKSYITAIGFSIFEDEEKENVENIQVISETNDYSIVEDLQNGMARIPEIVTPHKTVKQMVDMLPAEVWNDKTVFLDPACKGGEYLREIYDRLMENELLQAKYPNTIERSNHILQEQIYGIALSQVSLERTTKKLLGYGQNIRIIPNYIDILKGRGLESKPDGSQMSIREKISEEFGKAMKIDVVIGNPPYQENGNGPQKKPLYNKFVEMGLQLAGIVEYIIPSRWFSGGIGLSEFRHNILSCNRISTIINFKQANKVFRGLDIAGGVCIIKLQEHSDNLVFIDGETDRRIIIDKGFLINNEMLLDRCEAYSIVQKAKSERYLNSMIYPLNAFGLDADFEGSVISLDETDVEVVGSYGNTSYINIDELEKGREIVDKYKVIIGKASSEHAGTPGADGKYNVFSNNARILNNNQVCTFSYIVICATTYNSVAQAVLKYIKTKMCRFLVLVTLSSMNISAKNFIFVPLQDFTSNSDIKWSQSIAEIDKQVYDKYGLSDTERAYIEATIKPMT